MDIVYCAYTRGRRRRRRLTCDKLSQSSKWRSGVSIQQWSIDQIFAGNRESFIYTCIRISTPPLIWIVLNKLDRRIQSASEMLPFKKGAGCCTTAARLSFVDMRLADALVSFYSQTTEVVVPCRLSVTMPWCQPTTFTLRSRLSSYRLWWIFLSLGCISISLNITRWFTGHRAVSLRQLSYGD